VDRRTDIFAFGCVLYEMLTGCQAFDGEDVHDILSRVLQRGPDWSKLPSSLPPRVKEVLRRCLEKDLKNRFPDIGDVRIDIEQALKEPKEIALSPVHARGPRLSWVLLAVSGALVAVLSIPITRYLRERSIESPEMRLDINTPRTSLPLHFALSPDGM